MGVDGINYTMYCCHKHFNEEEEQKPAVAEQQVEVQTDSKVDGMCVGPTCCDETWYDNLPGCQAAQANGVCGGCEPFQVNGTKYCCHKHWNDSVLIRLTFYRILLIF